MQRPHAVMTVNDEVLARVLQNGGDFGESTEGHELSAIDAAEMPFIVFATINQSMRSLVGS